MLSAQARPLSDVARFPSQREAGRADNFVAAFLGSTATSGIATRSRSRDRRSGEQETANVATAERPLEWRVARAVS
jgi:hypothetical protein